MIDVTDILFAVDVIDAPDLDSNLQLDLAWLVYFRLGVDHVQLESDGCNVMVVTPRWVGWNTNKFDRDVLELLAAKGYIAMTDGGTSYRLSDDLHQQLTTYFIAQELEL